MLNESNEVRHIILGEIGRLLNEGGQPMGSIDDNHLLTDDVGLDSLALASLFISLEDHFGVDPFFDAANVVDMRTVGHVVQVYSDALSAQQPA